MIAQYARQVDQQEKARRKILSRLTMKVDNTILKQKKTLTKPTAASNYSSNGIVFKRYCYKDSNCYESHCDANRSQSVYASTHIIFDDMNL